jgi:hypothetical protein
VPPWARDGAALVVWSFAAIGLAASATLALLAWW